MLDDLIVLEIGEAITAPLASLILADLGAEVIKVEPPEWRRTLQTRMSERDFGGFLCINRGKKSIVLDFMDPEGRKIFEDLVKQADVVMSNYAPRAWKKLGLGYDVLGKINPRIICCNISGYGLKGKDIDRPAYDVAIQAVSGLMSITGEEGGQPLPAAGFPVDEKAGIMGVCGVLGAYIRLQKEGVGQQVDISMFDNSLLTLSQSAMIYRLTGVVPKPQGSSTSPDIRADFHSYQTKDSYFVLASGRSDEKWRDICKVLGKKELGIDPRYGLYERRVQKENRQFLVQTFKPIFRTKTTDEWVGIFSKAGISCAPVNTVDKALDKAESMGRGMIVEHPLPSGKMIKGIGNPLKIDRTENLSPPPGFGEHTKEVLLEKLNFNETKINELVKEKIIVLAEESGS